MHNPFVALVLSVVLIAGYYGYMIWEEYHRVKRLRKYYRDNCK